MREFNAWLNWLRTSRQWDILRHYAEPIPGRSWVDAFGDRLETLPNPPNVPKDVFEAWRVAGETRYELLTRDAVIAGLTRGGVHMFVPRPEEFTDLMEARVRFRWAEYRQPFPTFVVGVPAGGLPGQQADEPVPFAVVVRHSPEGDFGALTLGFDGRVPTPQNSGHATWWGGMLGANRRGEQADREIEDFLEGNANTPVRTVIGGPAGDGPEADEDLYVLTRPVGLDEDLATRIARLQSRVTRAALNACLIMVHHGRTILGSANPDHAARLRRLLEKRHVKPAVRQLNQSALDAVPLLYDFDRARLVGPDIPDPRLPADPTGRRHRFLGRKGHWANLAHGPGHSLRGEKDGLRTWRCSLPPNTAHLAFDPAELRVAYRTRPPQEAAPCPPTSG